MIYVESDGAFSYGYSNLVVTEISEEEFNLYRGGKYKTDWKLENNEFIILTPKDKIRGTIEARERIPQLKKQLSDTDYITMKYIEGEVTEEVYNEYKAKRKAWRDEINALEAEYPNI